MLFILCSYGCKEVEQNMTYNNDFTNEISNITTPTNSPKKSVDEGEFQGIDNEPIDFEDMIGVHKDFEVDEKLALEIGDAILKKVYGESLLQNTYYIVKENAKEEYFVVTRLPNDGVPGGDYSVVINKKDAKILRIWMGE